MSVEHVCDRCDARVAEQNGMFTRWSTIQRRPWVLDRLPDLIELCDTCTQSLLAWVRGDGFGGSEAVKEYARTQR